jgi:hypothetical protein
VEEGKMPEDAYLLAGFSLYDEAVEIQTYFQKTPVEEIAAASVENDSVKAQRMAAEIRLMMTVEANYSMLKQGITIDTTDLEIGDIILYDGNLLITHDKPEIHYLTGLNTYATPNPIQNGENSEIYAQLIDSYGYEHKEAGKTVHFFERVVPTITLSATASIIQTGDTVDVNAKAKDYDGSIIKNTKVYFYKEEEEE